MGAGTRPVSRKPTHIAVQAVPFALTAKVRRIGYIPGPGDRVAESLAAVGYEVTLLPEERRWLRQAAEWRLRSAALKGRWRMTARTPIGRVGAPDGGRENN